MRLFRALFALLLPLLSLQAAVAWQKPSPTHASSSSLTSPGFSPIDGIVQDGIDHHQWPGAVVLVGHDGKVVFRKAYGSRSLEPTHEPMTADTIFDMASLTKCLATATAVMQLYQQGRFNLNDPVAKYLPEFGANGKEHITIRQLLTHYSGLPPDLSLTDPWDGKAEAYHRAFAIAPAHPAGRRVRLQRHQFHHARRAGRKALRHAARGVHQPLHLSASRTSSHAVSSARFLASEHRAHAV